MKLSLRLKLLAIFFSVAGLLTVAFLPGCTSEKVAIPGNINDLSLVKIWDTVAKATSVQNSLSELESFRLMTDKEGKVDSLTYMFHEGTKGYLVDIDSRGELDWHSYQNTLPSTRHPLEVLSEIDKVKLSSLKPGEAGLLLQTDFSRLGNTEYSNEYLNIYELENGNLIPLKKIVFSSVPFFVISVYQRTNNGIGTTTTTVASGERTTTQTWFLSADVNNARIVDR